MAHQVQPSMTTRLVVAKTIGLLFGVLAMTGLTILVPESPWLPRFGLLFWYTTMGVFIGVVGVMDIHPVLGFRLPWWVRGPSVGGWMNFVLVFFAYDLMAEVILEVGGLPLSPFWFVLEGAVVGGIIGAASTYFGGEGPATLRE
jgi:hypothetical protein